MHFGGVPKAAWLPLRGIPAAVHIAVVAGPSPIRSIRGFPFSYSIIGFRINCSEIPADSQEIDTCIHEIAVDSQETLVDIGEIDTYTREIDADSREIGIYRHEITICTREIDIDRQEMTIYSREIAIYIQEIAAYGQEIAIYMEEMTVDSREMAANRVENGIRQLRIGPSGDWKSVNVLVFNDLAPDHSGGATGGQRYTGAAGTATR